MAVGATGSMSPGVVSGTYTGTTAAQTVQIGFQPSWIIGWNQTDGDTMYFWHTSSQTTYVKVTTDAISVTANLVPTDHGFTLAASDSIANENTKVFVFLAGR